MKKIKMLLSLVFLLIVTLTFAETEIPHQIIDDNPAKEVTTIESKKLKEKAELDILINKLTPIEIVGTMTHDGKTIYNIIKAEEEKNILNRVKRGGISTFSNEMSTSNDVEYFVTEDLSKILNENQKQYKGRSRRSVPEGVEYEVVNNNKNATTLTVNTNKPVYIARMRNGVLENVFSGNVRSGSSRSSGKVTINVGRHYLWYAKGSPDLHVTSAGKLEDTLAIRDINIANLVASPDDLKWGDKVWVGNGTPESAVYYSEYANLVDPYIKEKALIGIHFGLHFQYDNWDANAPNGQRAEQAVQVLKNRHYANAGVHTEGLHGPIDAGWYDHTVLEGIGGDFWTYNVNYIEDINIVHRYVPNNVTYLSFPGIFDRVNLYFGIRITNYNQGAGMIEGGGKPWVDNGGYPLYTGVYYLKSNHLNINRYVTNVSTPTYVVEAETYIVVPRANRSFTVTPNLNSINKVEMPNIVFDETKSIVSETVEVTLPDGQAKNKLPTDWNYRYNDASEVTNINNDNGLTLSVKSSSSFTIKKIEKRKVNVKNAEGLDVDIWLDNVAGVAKLKYQIKNGGKTEIPIDLIVQHKVKDGGNNYTLYQDNIRLTIPKGFQNVGTITAKIDKRLLNSGKYINVAKKEMGTNKDYSKLITIENNVTLNDGAVTAEVINYSNKKSDSNYKYFSSDTQYTNAVAIKNGATASLVNSDIYMRKGVGSQWTNAEILTSTDKLINLIVQEYDQNIPETGYVGTGTIGMSFAQINDTIEFPMGKDAKKEMNEKNGQNQMITSKFILKDFSGVFPTTNGITTSDINIVDNLRIIYRNGTIQNVSGKVYSDDKVKIEIVQSTGNLKITKLTNNVANQTMTIEYRYGDVVLGKFTLKIVNTNIIELPETTFTIDNRMRSLNSKWYFNKGSNGILVSETITGAKQNYEGLIQVSQVNYSGSAKIYRVNLIENRPFFDYIYNWGGVGYQTFLTSPNNWSGESAAPYGITLNELSNSLVVSGNNSSDTHHKNIINFVTEDMQAYRLSVQELFVGDIVNIATAELDFSNVELGIVGVWNAGVTGNASSENKNGLVLKFNLGHKLFSAKNIVQEKASVNKLVIKDDKGSILKEVIGELGEQVEATTEYNKFIIQGDGKLAISKIKHNYEKKIYVIEPYYNELMLGRLTVTILNDTPIDIGEVEFQLDNRFKNSAIGWVYIDKKGAKKIDKNEIDASTTEDYKELVDVFKRFKNLENKKIVNVISVDGKNQIRSYKRFAQDLASNEYIYFTKDSSSYAYTSSAIPYKNNITLNSLQNILATAVDKSVDDSENIFIVETEDGMRYKGNVKETYKGDLAIKAEGTIDFRKTSHIATWEPASSGMATNGKTSIIFTGTTKKLFDTRGELNDKTVSIATSLEVTPEGATKGTVTEQPDNNGNLTIKFDTGELFELDRKGRLTIRGSYENKEKTFVIKAYHNKVLLGSFIVKLITGDAFIIEGEDTYDFGTMLGGEIYNLTGKIHIRNLGKLEVTKVSVPTTASMIHKRDSTQTIPLKLQSSTTIVGEQDIDAVISVDALPIKNQAIGDYEGEFIVTITINEATN